MTAQARPGWIARLAQAWPGRRHGEALPVRDQVQVTPRPNSTLTQFDRPLLCVALALLALGLVMVYSASIALPDSPRFARYAPTHFLVRHAVALGLGFVFALLALQLPLRVWEKAASWCFVLSLLLLGAVLVPGVGLEVNGARRWLPLGLMNFQPSELAKLGIALYAASYMVRKMDVKEKFIQAVWPMTLALALVGVLLLAEPDMGAFLVIAMIALGILFLGGVNGRMFALGVAVLGGAFVLMIVTSPWRAQRIFAYLDPWNPAYAQGKAYQLTHSLIAFGRGELFGQGLGGSVEKLHYLPEAHTDFLLAVIAEELGFVGVLAVVVLFGLLVQRAFAVGRQALLIDRVFSGLAAQGIGIWLGVQAFINMGVNMGLLPTKGLTLPLMSFGGSGIVANCVALAILMRVDYENRRLMRGQSA